MLQISVENSFQSWRAAARVLISADINPGDIIWCPPGQSSLFETFGNESGKGLRVNVPPEFLELAETAACYDSAEKWSLLYRVLFRLVHEGRNLLQIESDPDVLQARLMEKAVSKDVHKFHAFVRFRRVSCEGDELFVAWHEPHHFTVERAAPFFCRRFGNMKFSIFTPKGCVHWDRRRSTFSSGVERISQIDDGTEDFWLTYYRSIFNPFRIKVSAMKKEMPVRHWRTLPEAALIKVLLREAGGRGSPSTPPHGEPAANESREPAG